MTTDSTNTVIDSAMSHDEILLQNPSIIAPISVIDELEILSVQYHGFDGKMHVGQICMNKSVSQDVSDFFKTALAIKFPIEKVIPISNKLYQWDDVVSCNNNNTSGYNYRTILGTTRLSNHAEGRAFDVNPVQNICIMYDQDLTEKARYPKDSVYDPKVAGTLIVDHPLVVLMKERGWRWGGDWKPERGVTDYQHFEK